jgi:hypothetical protein
MTLIQKMNGKTSKETQMKVILILSAALLLAGCDSQYRYPCQDPANWGKDECNNKVCKVEGECTSDVLEPKAVEDLIEDGEQ